VSLCHRVQACRAGLRRPGLPRARIDRAFDPTGYEDGGRPCTGLALTKAVIEQHGGRFGIESEPGEGTYAQMHLPLRG
jgi:two-component system, OmpR family, sensor kinase